MHLDQIDILEDEIREQYPEVLEVLLRDHITQKNIFWATNDYEYLGSGFLFKDHIRLESITGKFGQNHYAAGKKGQRAAGNPRPGYGGGVYTFVDLQCTKQFNRQRLVWKGAYI